MTFSNVIDIKMYNHFLFEYLKFSMSFVSFNFFYFRININFKILFINFKIFSFFLFDFNIMCYCFNIRLVMIIKIRDHIINSMFFDIDDIRKENDNEIINLRMLKISLKKFFDYFLK